MPEQSRQAHQQQTKEADMADANREQVTEDELAKALELLTKIDAAHDALSEWQKQFIADQKTRAQKWGPDLRLSPKQFAQIEKAATAAGVE